MIPTIDSTTKVWNVMVITHLLWIRVKYMHSPSDYELLLLWQRDDCCTNELKSSTGYIKRSAAKIGKKSHIGMNPNQL